MEGPNKSWSVIRLFQCIKGPRLRRLYYMGRNTEGTVYSPNKLERYADNVILAAYLLFSCAYHVTPVYFIYYVIRYGIPSFTGVFTTLRGLSVIPVLSVSLAYIVRGIGRYGNDSYHEFLVSLNSARNLRTRIGPIEARATGINKYDFEMFPYPLSFRHDESTVKPRRLSSSRSRGIIERLISLPMTSVRYVAGHLIGRRAIYPGSLAVLNMLLNDPLTIGRAKLRREHNGHRDKLLSCDGNHIDCVFVDKRGSPDTHARGNKLVICCEGNAAYYEVGIMEIPLSVGFSVLGWNHPGFGESTGLPFPDQEYNAIDVVIRYAITHLGFSFENIIIFAWSIGGYTASCAAMSYPDIGGVILDATFDELFPLAKSRVPDYLENITHGMIKECFDLNIAQQMCCYQGPISIIRRENDEMMSINGDVSTNRANFLLIKILQTRYPNIITTDTLQELLQWLKAPKEWGRRQVMINIGVDQRMCRAILTQYMNENGSEYPWLLGDKLGVEEKKKLLLFLASQYMLHHDSTHCQPVPPDMMELPGKNGNLRN